MPSLETTSELRFGATRLDTTLALIYQGLLTGTVRIQAGRQTLENPDAFRNRVKAALKEAEREAGLSGYSADEIRDAQFAVVAFLDEVILSTRVAGYEQWSKKTLNVEMFGEAIAGEVFFDKLKQIEGRRDSPRSVELLELYLLCLLLGFEGRYSGPYRAELYEIRERLRRRVEGERGLDYKLSPALAIARSNSLPEEPAADGARWWWWAAGLAAGTAVLFLLLKLHLLWRLSELDSLFTFTK